MAHANYPHPILDFSLKYEGGDVDNKKDPGGRTSRGVIQKNYDAYRFKKGLPKRDVYLMTESELQEIYRTGYWEEVRGDSLPSGEDAVVFDYGVNSGPAKANAAYAKALVACKLKATVPNIVSYISDSRLTFLHGLTTWKTFGRGWAPRVAANEALGLKLGLGADAPAAIIENSKKAAATAQKKKTKGVASGIGGSATAGAATSPSLNLPTPTDGLPHWLILSILGIGVLGACIFLFESWLQSQRSDALASAAHTPTA